MKGIPIKRPVTWIRYRCARESPLNSIDTTSVSMIAAFIWDKLNRRLPGAILRVAHREVGRQRSLDVPFNLARFGQVKLPQTEFSGAFLATSARRIQK